MVLWSNLGLGVACKNADARSGRSAGLSKESAGEASNLMRRPARQGDRNATTSACVGWDFNNIENRPVFRKEAHSGVVAPPSERPHNYQDNDPDHQTGRHLIDNTIEFLASGVSVSGEILNAAGKKAVDAR